MNIRLTCLASLAAAICLSGGNSEAAFTHTSVESTSGITVGLSSLTLMGNSGGPFSGTTNINAINVGLSSTASPTATNAFSLTFIDTITINTVGDGTTTIAINETLNFTRSDAQGSTSNLVVNSILPVSSTTTTFRYTISAALYAQPTVNGSTGNISYTVTETPLLVVPEPASLAMLAMGLGGAAIAGVRRKRVA